MGPIASLPDLIAALWRQRWLILAVLLVGLPAAYAYAKSRPRLYEAVAVVQVEAPEVSAEVSAAVAAAADAGQVNARIDLLAQTLMGRESIEALVERFGLFPEAETLTERVGLTREAIETAKIVDPAQAWRPDARPTGLSVAVRLPDAEDAAAVANALLDRIVAEAAGEARARASRTLDFLVAEEARLGAEIAAVEAGIADYRATHVASLPEGVTAQRERLGRLGEEARAVETRALELEAEADRLRPEEAARRRGLIEDGRGLVAAAVAETEAALAAAPGVERELGARARNLGGLEAELAEVRARRAGAAVSARLEGAEAAGGLSVLERAVVPDFAVSADRRKVALAGAGAVGALALALGLAREATSPGLRTAAQMQRVLGVEPLIVVPRLTSRRDRLGRRLRLAAAFVAVAAGAALLGRAGLQAAGDLLPAWAVRG